MNTKHHNNSPTINIVDVDTPFNPIYHCNRLVGIYRFQTSIDVSVEKNSNTIFMLIDAFHSVSSP